MARNKGPVSVADLMHLAQHAVENSHGLLEEAQMLLDSDHPARAGALAVLAVEESGKAHLCHIQGIHRIPSSADPHDPHEWEWFWDQFSDHPGKLDALMSRAYGGRCEEIGEWKDVANILHVNKLRCLYVDWLPEEGGALITPSKITRDEAKEMIDTAQEILAFVEGVKAGDD